jgi:2-C-methyl-D-erythritol 4-phosphate cytidylyltransferase/2-C-methyl-D-erythritol 2,4-cyclodiphosphate synthase
LSVAAAILAAGQGTRFGGDKTGLVLRGRPVWRWSVDTYLDHPDVDQVLLVTAPERVETLRAAVPESVTVLAGGSTRQASSRAALAAAEGAEVILVHDAARPFVSLSLIGKVAAEARAHGAAAAGLPVTDTIKQVEDGRVTTLPRHRLFAMQTPQGARTELLREAHAHATEDLTDEMALLEAIGVHPRIVPGEPTNFKITTPEDLLRAQSLLGVGETRTGLGYDIHPFSDDPSRELWLGGVHFPDHPALDGHSDADVLLHAVTDALLGAAAMGDIGQHFPNTDPRWKGAPSLHFLRHAVSLLVAEGWQVVHLDMTCIAETPKIMRRADDIRQAVAEAAGVEASRVSVKATTNERLGSIGRSEGIAAFATATIRRL